MPPPSGQDTKRKDLTMENLPKSLAFLSEIETKGFKEDSEIYVISIFDDGKEVELLRTKFYSVASIVTGKLAENGLSSYVCRESE